MNWNGGEIVPFLHHRKEGRLRHQKISPSNRDGRSRGGFRLVFIGEPPRLRNQRMLRNFFLIAQPPLLAVMQGGVCYDRRQSLFSTSSAVIDRRYSVQGTESLPASSQF